MGMAQYSMQYEVFISTHDAYLLRPYVGTSLEIARRVYDREVASGKNVYVLLREYHWSSRKPLAEWGSFNR